MRSLRFLTLALVVCLAIPVSADILKVTIDGVIHPITEEVVDRAIREAEANGDSALLIVLRTPGGLETSMRKMIEKIVASKVPVIVYVSPGGSRAASAGFFLLVSADVAAMAPGTNTGAAHPVVIGQEKVDEIMNAKMTNDSAAFMRSIVATRGRNVELAEKAVLESVSFTEQEALDQKLIDIVAKDEADLLRQLEGRTITRFNGETQVLALAGQPVRERVMTLRQRVMNWMMDPNIAFLLLSLGALALYAEFNHPGSILPGVVGLILILLAVFALNLLPTRFAALTLIVIAFVLFALEAKYTSYGVLGAGGVVCMTLGAVLLVDGPIPEMRVQWLTALAISVPFGVIAVFLMTIAMRAMRSKVVTGEQGLVGEVGVAKTALDPEGKIFVHGEIWNAVSEAPVAAGDEVRVESVDGLTLAVKPSTGVTPPAE
ncbi:MAG: nodulation protein NfeD [Thermoanaerobaculia bacterium]|nr:nodulation protein NfeD [Thermoanaerobaculia bacterium]